MNRVSAAGQGERASGLQWGKSARGPLWTRTPHLGMQESQSPSPVGCHQLAAVAWGVWPIPGVSSPRQISQKQELGPGPSLGPFLQDPFVLGLAAPAFADPMLPSSSQATDRCPCPPHFC